MRARNLAAVSALLLGLGCQSAPEGTVAFVNASVVPMDNERVLHGQTVVTSLGKISELGPTSEIKVPRGALVVDGSGKYLIPGLTEMHAHLPAADTPPEEVDRILFLFLSNGVTTVRGCSAMRRTWSFANRSRKTRGWGRRSMPPGPRFEQLRA